MPFQNEPIPQDTISSMLSTNWNTNSNNTPTPTFFIVNDGTTAIRFDLTSGDYIGIKADTPSLEENPIGTWIYAHQKTRVLLELYTSISRQRLWNTMKEVRRICHSQMHNLTNYQRVQFASFDEIVDEQQRIWKGRIIIELINSAAIMNITADT